MHFSYRISLGIRQRFSLSKQPQKSRSILQDGSRSLRLFRKGKTHIIAKFHWTDLVICNHSGDGKPPSYSRINTVILPFRVITDSSSSCVKSSWLVLALCRFSSISFIRSSTASARVFSFSFCDLNSAFSA